MQVSDYPTRLHGNWNRIVIAVAVAALTCSVATRTFRLKASNDPTVQSSAEQAMRQHMDRDAARWLPPLPVFAVLDAPDFYPHFAPAAPPALSLPLHSPLYDRPPPYRG